jgi:hypothetical protein
LSRIVRMYWRNGKGVAGGIGLARTGDPWNKSASTVFTIVALSDRDFA